MPKLATLGIITGLSQNSRCKTRPLLPRSLEKQEVVYHDRNQTIYRVVAKFAGFSKEYFVSDHGQRAVLVAVRDGAVLLVRQYRLLINGLSYEIPGGRVDEGESPETAVARECLEEAGIQCTNLHPLINYHASLDIWKYYTYVFISEECREMSTNYADRRVWMPLDRCLEMAFTQRIVDSLSITVLLAYHASQSLGLGQR